MGEDSNVEDEFWSNVPDGRLDRFRAARRPRTSAPRAATRPAGTRSHGDHTGSIPVVTAPARAAEAASGPIGHVDPLLRRVGVLAIVVALLVPVALAMRSSSTDSTAPAAADAATLLTAGTDAVQAPDTSADPWAAIDVEALPPAVPANPDPTASAAGSTVGDQQGDATIAASTVAAATVPKVARAQAKSTTATVCAAKYTVASGDAWILIANRAKVTLTSLLAVNNATASTALYPGRSICLPAGATTPKAPTTTQPAAKAPTTTAPKAPTTTAPKPAKSYTKAQVTQIIRDIWPDNLEDKAIAIATRESNLTPAVRNYCCFGLFQIYYKVHKTWLATLGITSAEQLYDPKINTYAAYVMYQRSGWGPWAL